MPKSTPRRRSALASQQIDDSGPGSILADFDALLNFVQGGVRSTGKYHLLPMDRLFELDERMTSPLRPRLQRPQQRSFPHLNGLYLLARTTQLVIPQGQGKTSGRLVLESAMHEQWLALNATERYFNLLEAWLRLGCWDTVGLYGGRGNRVFTDVQCLCRAVPASGLDFSQGELRQEDFLHKTERACTLALLELFGLMQVPRDQPAEGQGWRVRAVHRTSFGDALLDFAFEEMMDRLFELFDQTNEFGAWQQQLRRHFPQWIHNLQLPEPECRDGVFYFKVSLGQPWRRIAIPAQSDLDEFAECIIRAFDFDGDHLYGFQMAARDGRPMRIEHPYVNDAQAWTDEVLIGELPLTDGQAMLFQYDFGADWRFDVKLEKVEPQDESISEPTVVASRGEAPPEYEFDDEYGDDDEDW